ncbi:MAG: hypothetical protein C4324_05460 [Blastocatellia bacterium]
MNKDQEITPQSGQIQSILNRFLASVPLDNPGEPHLDEDFLTAFIEGNLDEFESEKAVGHLVDCGFCRSTTAELIRLDYKLAETLPEEDLRHDSEPAKISDVLNRLVSRIFGPLENAVFAHEDRKTEPEGEENNSGQPKD